MYWNFGILIANNILIMSLWFHAIMMPYKVISAITRLSVRFTVLSYDFNDFLV
jgi:hypothetical protein